MTAVTPTLHTFDPLLAGKVGLNIDPQGLANGDQVYFYVSGVSGGPYTQLVSTCVHTGVDALSTVFDYPSGTLYCVAKAYQGGSTSAYSSEVAATVSAGPPPPPPPLTDVEMINEALGVTLTTGDKVNVYPPAPTTSQTVNADGSIS